VRVVLRHLERSLTYADAYSPRDRIYDAIHQGARHQCATGARPAREHPPGVPEPAGQLGQQGWPDLKPIRGKVKIRQNG
jgi:hypothetical protein